MDHVSNEDRYAVLERKLRDAESALFGCRAILNHIRRTDVLDTNDIRRRSETSAHPERAGLYDGQLDNCVEPDYDDPSSECVE